MRRRLALVVALSAAVFSAAGVLASTPASAHPLGNFTVNRYSGLTLSPGRVEVRYVLDMAEIPTYQETPNIDSNSDGVVSAAERQAWADRQATRVLSGVTLTVGGETVFLRVAGDSMSFRSGQAGLPILRFVGVLDGSLPGTSGSVSYRDDNYADRIGWKEITVQSRSGVALAGSTAPVTSVSRELLAYPKDLLSSPLNVTSARFRFQPGQATLGGTGHSSEDAVSGAPVASGGAFAGLVGWRLTPLILILSLGLACLFGAVHALGPGHGKTITAAYLVGAGAKTRQAVFIGLAVSVMHTASVVALGLVAVVLVHSFPAERVYPWLGLITGLVALGLGTGLLLVRIRARRQGLDPWGHGHSHPWDEGGAAAPRSHEHGHGAVHRHVEEMSNGRDVAGMSEGVGADATVPAPSSAVLLLEYPSPDPLASETAHGHVHPGPGHGGPARRMSGRGLVALAVAGGILPSPTALVVLTGAIYAHRVGYGLSLIVAFSAGLAAALMFIGLLALRARSFVSARLGGRWGGIVPVASAAVIMGFGLFFALRGAFLIA